MFYLLSNWKKAIIRSEYWQCTFHIFSHEQNFLHIKNGFFLKNGGPLQEISACWGTHFSIFRSYKREDVQKNKQRCLQICWKFPLILDQYDSKTICTISGQSKFCWLWKTIRRTHCTPVRTLSISGLKSRVLKLAFLT